MTQAPPPGVPAPPPKHGLARVALASVLLGLAVLAVYLPALQWDFVNYDDPFYVTDNLQVLGGMTWQSTLWAFTQAHAANWHPLTWLSHMLDVQLFGLNPAGHHFTNLLLHTANSVLLFLWLRWMTGAFWRNACVAALFALHPLRVESVAWVSERKDVLSTFFGLLCLWAYARYVQQKGDGRWEREDGERKIKGRGERGEGRTQGVAAWGWYGGALGLFALGLMSKPMLVTWPCVMLLLDVWPLQRLQLSTLNSPLSTLFRLFLEKLPFFTLSAASSIVTVWAQKVGGAVAPLEQITLGLRILNALVAYFEYLVKLVWPTRMAVIYPYTAHWPIGEVLIAVLALAGITFWVLRQRKQRSYLPVGWAWYLGTLVPVIGLVQVGNQAMADRYSYIPSIGLFVMVTWGAAELVRLRPVLRGVAAVGATTVLIGYALTTQAQVLCWQNTERLFRQAIAVTPNNFIAHNNLGFYLADLRELEEAKRCYQAALAINPRYEQAYNNLGCALLNQGRHEEAITNFQAALRLAPGLADAQNNWGTALVKQGKLDESIPHYQEALRLRPDYALAHHNLANVLADKGQREAARKHYREALQWNPRSANAHSDFAHLLAKEGQLDAATSEYQVALGLQPGLQPALYGLGETLARQSKPEEAGKVFSELLQLCPSHAAARLQLGLARVGQGRMDAAVEVFTEALRINSDDFLAHYHLATTLSRQGKAKEAVHHYREALRGLPDFPEALNNLAWILAANSDPQIRNGAEAVRLAQQACQATEYQQSILIGTLAAAYAEAGRFPEAVVAAEKARTLAEKAGETEVATRNQQLLEFYRAGRAYHEDP